MGISDLRIRMKDREKNRERRKKERERQQRRVHKYGQASLKHARRGVISCTLAVVAAFLMVLIFSVSYISRGDVNLLIGLAGIMALVIAAFGLWRGIEGLKERNKNYISCKAGIVCNAILLLSFVVTYIRGYF